MLPGMITYCKDRTQMHKNLLDWTSDGKIGNSLLSDESKSRKLFADALNFAKE